LTRILVFSDSHGDTNNIFKTIDKIPDINAIIHLGDIYRDIVEIKNKFPFLPICFVRGNNDYNISHPQYKIIKIDEVIIFLTHGHNYICGLEIDRLKKIAIEKNAQITLYGHSHIADYELDNGRIYANPGSISRPRYGECSYGIIEIDNKNFKYSNINA
jgi:putative phosphoesterase